MEISLAQENWCSEDCSQNSMSNGDNDNETISSGSVGTGGGKRNSLKKWLHKAVLGYDVDDSFDNEDTVVIEEDDDLVFIPTTSDLSNGLFSSNKELSPLLFEQNPGRKNYRRQKIKDFKFHLKMRMRLARGDETDKNGEMLYRRQCLMGQDGGGDSGEYNEEELDCYQMFKTQPEHLDALFDYAMKSSLEQTSPSDFADFNYASSPVKELQPFQNLNYDDINLNVEHAAFVPLDVWDIDKESDSKRLDSAEDPRVCGSSNDSKGEEDCPTLSMDSTEMESFTTGESTERSLELTPSVYLANELTMKDGATGSDVANDSFNSTEGEVEETSCEDSQDTQNTLCSSGSPSIDSVLDSGDSNTIIYTIPTFKQGRGQLNVSGIIQSFKDGTLTEKNLTQMAKGSSLGLSFRSKEFYEQPPSSDEDEQAQGRKQEMPMAPSENDNIREAPENYGVEFAGNGEGVKFDKYSHILVYRAVKRNVQDKGFSCPSLRTPNNGNSSITSGVSESPSASKPILKKTDNERESEEIVRATLCDKVDVKSFLAYFEYFEHQKHSDEVNLSKFREEQLSHYYSKEFFPELLEDIKFKHAFNSEYRKSKMATELNIGRKIGDGDEQHVRRLVNVIEDPTIGSANFK
ncbi:hypothetical protein ZYGR_0A01500 [Zygosaccharomyces rouxii]|uniref:ZYRO0A03388p n=2 Tax=Zygosaccharomyces rouxii TaxID=4956 RepID=C5DPH4_ZYGRC|nr:uncharacterized protein ZYRO0A03388g [Zygosaccharomyces rouxii]KAH9198894.1 hypothetical protein LQ764DRAFT_142976 [Zygosaccharomyces rouxii]GAV46558.1 hypothetical protein ZYGR_0A01500 [Zygosaccharomyces rouxii]CAR25585.1 ZYRO0A03388p [Zygosaccharomyces rouxii]